MTKCPECGEVAQVWADNSGGVTVNYACDNAACDGGKGPWDTPRPTDEPAPSPVHYHWGQNIPGYMPMTDEPNTAARFEWAQASLLLDMERVADHYGMADEDDDHAASMLESIEQAIIHVASWDAPDTTYVASDQPHDLGLAFWVIACAETECEVEE